MDIRPQFLNPKNNPSAQCNELYQLYKIGWAKTFEELDSKQENLADRFKEFDSHLGLFLEDQLIGFHAYRFFDLNLQSDREHSYFQQLDIPFVESLIEKNIKRVATMEYLYVDPAFRKTNFIPTGEILAGFSIQYLGQQNIDGIVTITRNNRQVNQICENFGSFALYEDLKLHNVSVDVMCFTPNKIKDTSDFQTQKQVDLLLKKVGIHKNSNNLNWQGAA